VKLIFVSHSPQEFISNCRLCALVNLGNGFNQFEHKSLPSGEPSPHPGYSAARAHHALPAFLRARPWSLGIKDHCRPRLCGRGGLWSGRSRRSLRPLPHNFTSKPLSLVTASALLGQRRGDPFPGAQPDKPRKPPRPRVANLERD
jgi:hypothetical protein